MSDFQPADKDDDWKRNIQEALISAMTCSGLEQLEATLRIGQLYHYSAPASLFKYFGDEDRDLETIKANSLWYCSPSKYNDVFDCEITVDEAALFVGASQLAPEGVNLRRGSPAWKNLQQILRKELQSFRSTIADLRGNMGIACFSESDDSLLMWAHYANNHRGMCVEYDLMEINKQLSFSPVPVIYSKDRVCFNVLNPSTIEKDTLTLFIQSIITKSEEWRYEREWRIVRDNTACGDRWNSEKKGALLDMICPSSITLGCAAEGKFEKSVKEYCEKHKIPLYKMQKDDTQYKLNKVAILDFGT